MPLVRLLLSSLLACTALHAGAQAQRSSGDYYFDRSDAAQMQLLSNLERNHMAGCAEGVTTRRFEQSLADCEFILRYYPNHPKALLGAADICLAWKAPRCDAVGFFDQGIAANPKAATTYAAKGIYLLRAGQVDPAIAALKEAASLDPNSVNAQYNLGLAYFEAKQYDLANAAAQRAYMLGAPVPGLREKLRKAGYWKPQEAASSEPAQPSPKGQVADAPKQ